MDTQFPERTADETEVQPNKRASEEVTMGGTKVWMQTLNALHKQDAAREANISTSRELRRYRKGSELYQMLLEDFGDQDVEAHIDFLTSHELLNGRWLYAAQAKFPDLLYPERAEGDDDQKFIEAVAKYDTGLEELAAKRTAHIESEQQKYEKQIRGWTVKTRIERCVTAYIEKMFLVTYNVNELIETLYRAVRKNNNRAEKYFKSVEEVRDLDDDVRDALTEKYRELDSVKYREIPTSPESS